MLDNPVSMPLVENLDYSPGTARRLRQKLQHLFSGSKTSLEKNNNLSSVIETDYLQGISTEDQDNLRQKGVYAPEDAIPLYFTDPGYGLVEDSVDAEQSQDLADLVRSHLREKTTALHLDLFLPNDLLDRISKDVIRMSYSEPYGLRGCSLIINLQKNDATKEIIKLGRVECDQNTVSTFELHLTLIEDKKRWYSFKDLIAPVLPGCLNESQALEVFISPGYRISKVKLYRPNY